MIYNTVDISQIFFQADKIDIDSDDLYDFGESDFDYTKRIVLTITWMEFF